MTQITLVSTEPVTVAQSDLTVRGVAADPLTVSGLAYDSGTYAATWTLAQPVTADRLLLDLSDSVTDARVRQRAGR